MNQARRFLIPFPVAAEGPFNIEETVLAIPRPEKLFQPARRKPSLPQHVSLRFCAAGIAVANAFGLSGAARQAGVLQASMPSAVICTILAARYDLEPEFVTSVVVVTTLLSPITLTPLLAFLGA